MLSRNIGLFTIKMVPVHRIIIYMIGDCDEFLKNFRMVKKVS